MRTTVNLPDALAEAAKRRAAEEGRTFTSLVEEGLRAVLDDRPDREPYRLSLFEPDAPGGMLIDPADKRALWEALDAQPPA